MRWSKPLIGLSFLAVTAGCSDSTSNVAGLTPSFDFELDPAGLTVPRTSTTSTLIERPANNYLAVGGSLALTAKSSTTTATGNRRSFASTATTAVVWESSNTQVLLVSSTGVVTGHGPGKAYVRAISGGALDSVQLESISTSPISVSPNAPSIVVGATTQLTSNAANEVTWTSSNTAIATVSATGLVTGVAAGNATFTATNAIGIAGSVPGVVTPVASNPVAPPPVQPPTTPTTPPGGSVSFVQPTAPTKTVDVSYPTLSGVQRVVSAGGNLQATLDAAQPGDEVILAQGAVFTGNFVLPAKSGTAWIVIRSATVAPVPGERATVARLSGSARIVSPNAEAAILTAPGAARWRLVGFEVAQGSTGINYGLVVLGVGNETTLAAQPSQIVLDRMYVHGNATADLKRCVAFNGAYLAVIDSYLAECHGKGFDAQGIAGWNGPGPFLIENNRIEGSGQAVMFGGADPKIANVSPSDITVRRNYLYKPMSWGGGRWTVKATFELKHGKRVLFEGNVLENHWADAQTGFAILFQTLADDNTSWAWTTVQDVLVRNNLIKTSTAGVNVLARVAYNGGVLPTNPASRIALVNNLFQNVGRDPVSGASGRIFQLLNDLQDMTVVNNTVTLSGGTASHAAVFDGNPQARLVFANNVLPSSDYGLFGSGKGIGTATLEFYAPGYLFKGNVVPSQNGGSYPADNFFPSLTSLLFNSDYSLSSLNPFATGVLGSVGVNATSLASATAGVTQ